MNYKVLKIVAVVLVAAGIFVLAYKKPVKDVPVVPVSSVAEPSKPDFIPTAKHDVYDQKGKTLTELKEYNPDTVAWMTMPGTLCDNVVVLGEDEIRGKNYYLDHSYDHRSTTAGTLYIDHRTTFTKEKLSRNITIYGHHMKDGTMFAQIERYRSIAFYREHPYFTFETLYGEYDAQVFALYVLDLTDPDDYSFDFRGPDYESDEAYMKYIDEVNRRSKITTGVKVEPSDSILTLCTCTYVSSDARLMVSARLVPKGEGKNVDVNKASKK